MIRLNDREFCEIVEYIRDNYGINLEKKQVLIECRMARELEKRGLTSFAQYMEQMRKDRTGEMAGEMVNRLTTNYTYFMREPAHFSILHYKILPELFENRKMGDVIGDLNKRRGQVEGMDTSRSGARIVKAMVPLAEMFGYVTALRTITSGRATSSMTYDHHAPVSSSIAKAVLEEIKGRTDLV